MKSIETRKTIALASMLVIAFTVIYCLVTGREIPQTSNTIITALIGYIGYYFGKSTALDTPKTNIQ